MSIATAETLTILEDDPSKPMPANWHTDEIIGPSVYNTSLLAVPPHLPVYILVQHEHAEQPFRTCACDTHACLAASATLDDAKNLAASNKQPVIAHSVRAASRRAMYLVGLYMRHASGRPLCTPRDIGGSSGSPHARELQALCHTGLVRRRRRFRDITRDGSWTYALTAVGDAAALCLIERSNRSWTEEDRSARMNKEEN